MCTSSLLLRFLFCKRERGKVRGIFYPLVHSSDGCNSQVWARLESGAENSILVFLVGAGPQALGVSFSVFLVARSRSASVAARIRTQQDI